MPDPVSAAAPAFVRDVLGEIIAGRGDLLPVSKLPCDGTFPTATARWEKRNIALEIPVWDTAVCIQCGKCAMVCPHGVIRAKVYEAAALRNAPATFKSADARDRDLKGLKYTIQVAPEDCTGCALCVDVCPAKNKSEPRLQGDQHGGPTAVARTGAGELGFLPEYSRARPPPYQGDGHPAATVAAAVV